MLDLNTQTNVQTETQKMDSGVESEHLLSNVEWIVYKLTIAFPQARINVEDTRGDDQHLSVTITSSVFSGKSRIACHQMVYAALDQMRNHSIHALALRTHSE